MKTIKSTTQFLVYGLILLLAVGCNNFLNESDPSHYTTSSYYTNASEAQKAVNAIYASVYPFYSLQAWMIDLVRTGIVDTNFPADAAWPSLIKAKQLGNFSTHPDLETIWNTYYQGIANANLAIANIPDITMNMTKKKQLLGQAHFLRAYYYFNLVRLFGEVPLIKSPIRNLNSPKLQPKQAPVDSVYDLIVKDLKIADSSKLPFNSKSGRVTGAAVKSLLSTVYITMAGYPLQGGIKYYKLARDEAEAVINSGVYHLFGSYNFLKDPGKDNLGGYIFEIQFNQNNHPNNSLQEGFIPYRRGISVYSAEEGFVFVLKKFIDTYKTGDKRVKAYFFNKYTSATNRSDTVHFNHYYIYKFFNKDAIENTARSGLNWPVIRYSEVLLNYAEASNEISGPTVEAYNAVNKIRERAGIPNLSGLTKSEFRKAIWIERYHEMCFENKIWFLMARTRKAFNIKTGGFEDYVGHTFIYGITLQERDLLFPIPFDELRNNSNLKQNPGF